MSLKVFISHSSKDDPSLLEGLKNRIQKEGFELRFDQGNLRAGDEWREELRKWMYDCDAAIILFSSSAITSSWVIAETIMLTWRRALDRTFLLIPYNPASYWTGIA